MKTLRFHKSLWVSSTTNNARHFHLREHGYNILFDGVGPGSNNHTSLKHIKQSKHLRMDQGFLTNHHVHENQEQTGSSHTEETAKKISSAKPTYTVISTYISFPYKPISIRPKGFFSPHRQ